MTDDKEIVSANNGLGALSVRGYDIAGNKIRAFFDDAGNLVFVIDDTTLPDKPNALLVIDSFDGRKWDDILVNDYGVALEAVRPKKDNKYQKLDIEYTGLDEYDDLIHRFDAGDDLTDALGVLMAFRGAASRRAARERLDAAETAAENARETIQRAGESIAELQVRLKTLRAKLTQQKKAVGREPTKQSAAKILRTESQIDALKDKSRRAQRRLDNARRRLVAAEDDAEIARAILARLTDEDIAPATLPAVRSASANMPAVSKPGAVATVSDEINLPVAAEEYTEEVLNENIEQKAEKMADEEVKPLFDKDPEILDEEIAFKPIDFNVPGVPVSDAPKSEAQPRFDDYSDTVAPAPLSFTPPTDSAPAQAAPADMPRTSSVLDTITSVEMPSAAAPRPMDDTAIQPAAPAQTPAYGGYSTTPAPQARPMGVSPAVPGAATAPVRPVSPVTGTPATPVAGGGNNGRKPTLLYYVLLIALIALSIFTLWLYQSKNSETVPDLQATATAEKTETADTENAPNPFIGMEEQTVTVTEPASTQPTEPQDTAERPVVAPAPVAEPTPESEPVPVPAAPVIDETIPAVPVVPEPAETAPTALPDETPFITEPTPEPEPAKPVVVNKPAYNAGSQNENMFVADVDYDTDVAPVAATEPVPVEAEYQETVEMQSGPVCDDGTAPTADGCCGDEIYTNISGGAYACCSESTGDCYPPLF